MTIRILLISPLPPPASGISSWTKRILDELSFNKLFKVYHLDTAVRWRSTNDIRLAKRISGGTFQAAKDIIRSIYLMVKNRIETVHLCTSGSLSLPKDIIIILISKIFRTRVAFHYRKGNLKQIYLNDKFQWFLLRIALILSDKVIILDKKSEKYLSKALPMKKIYRIPNPIDCNLPLCIRNSELSQNISYSNRWTIVFAGWVVRTKGVEDLLRACLNINNYPIKLVFIGNVLDDYKIRLKKIVSSERNNLTIKFTGMLDQNETLKKISHADIFVLPSWSEGFPNVILEAMALGRPIIATKVGAIPEMLNGNSESMCGIIVPRKDISSLEKAIRYLIENPDIAEKIGKNAQKKVDNEYSLKSVMSEYYSVWI